MENWLLGGARWSVLKGLSAVSPGFGAWLSLGNVASMPDSAHDGGHNHSVIVVRFGGPTSQQIDF